MAVIAYDRNEGKGINFKDINDIRQTFFHEWTHVMELDKIKTNQETEVSLNGRIFKNNEKKKMAKFGEKDQLQENMEQMQSYMRQTLMPLEIKG